MRLFATCQDLRLPLDTFSYFWHYWDMEGKTMNTATAIDHLAVAIGLTTLQCIRCARTLVPGGVYGNGYADGPVLCAHCKQARNHEAELELLDAEEGEI